MSMAEEKDISSLTTALLSSLYLFVVAILILSFSHDSFPQPSLSFRYCHSYSVSAIFGWQYLDC